jgi:hypothetical protein
MKEYKFECIHMKGGWCVETDEPGCYYDCHLKNCDNCVHRGCPPRKEPCVKCWIREENHGSNKSN